MNMRTNMGRTSLRASMLLLAVALAFAGGCDVDSFGDPSNVIRAENTPVVLPILDRLDVIDEPVEEFIGLSEITPEDLIAEPTTYTIGPGDVLTVSVFSLVQMNEDHTKEYRVDEKGFIDLPVIYEVQVGGLTAQETKERIVSKLKPDILMEPIVGVHVSDRRQRTFTIYGTRAAGPYTIHKTNFLLTDAIALGGGLPSNTRKIYVFRRVVITPGTPMDPQSAAPMVPEAPRDPVEVLEELTQPEVAPEPEAPAETPAALAAAMEPEPMQSDEGRYVNVDGEWVLVDGSGEGAVETKVDEVRTEPEAEPASTVVVAEEVAAQPVVVVVADPAPAKDPEPLVTQRVIEIDVDALFRGDVKQNIVIRTDDIVRVPEPRLGHVFIEGEINRIGAYEVNSSDPMTITALFASAGGLGPLAIPERVDIYRRIGRDQQAIMRLNYRAILEGQSPNIFLKPNDEIRIGTNAFASHLAVIRNGFRMTYGFGFLLDRNFGSDVFGAAPFSRFSQ